MKRNRHTKILEIIASRDVETQEQLIDLLKEDGFSVTQATVSRDIKDLKLVKVAGKNGAYKYAVSGEDGARPAAKFHNIMKETVTSIDHSGNIVVIKTYAGMAAAAAASIDSLKLNEILGSLAGDDTILLVMRSESAANEFSANFYNYFKA